MRKFLTYLISLLMVIIYILWQECSKRANVIFDITAKNKELQSRLDFEEKRYEKEINTKTEVCERQEILREESVKDTSFDWNADISNSSVVKQLHKD